MSKNLKKQWLTAEKVRELLHYDSNTGQFSWKVDRRAGVKAGDKTGRIHHSGYVHLTILGRCYSAHRIAWLHYWGEWPEQNIDHINGIRTDNRIANLRDVSKSENSQNQKGCHRDNPNGYLGVNRRGKRFIAQITTGGVYRYLGRFDTAEEAASAYLAAKKEHHHAAVL